MGVRVGGGGVFSPLSYLTPETAFFRGSDLPPASFMLVAFNNYGEDPAFIKAFMRLTSSLCLGGGIMMFLMMMVMLLLLLFMLL